MNVASETQPLMEFTRLRPVVRVAIVIDTPELRGWRRIAFERLSSDPYIQICAFIDVSKHPERPRTFLRSATDVLWNILDTTEARLSKRLLHGIFARVNGFAPDRLRKSAVGVSGLRPDAPRVRASAIDTIKDYKTDFLLDLTDAGWIATRPGLSKFGTLRLRSALGSSNEHVPLGFTEFMEGEPLCEIQLAATGTGGPGDGLVAIANYCTYPWSWSVNEVLLGFKASWLLTDFMHKWKGKSGSSPLIQRGPTRLTRERDYRSILDAPLLLAKCTGRLISKMYERLLFEEQWRILLMEAHPNGKISAGPVIINPPPDRYWADPFVIRKNGKVYVFVEEYFYSGRRGMISYIEVNDLPSARLTADYQSHLIIDEPYHLSYPFLFEYRDEIFMIPESSANKTIDLWRATEFPNGWKKHKTLISGISATDTSLLQWDGKWWLFTNIDRNGLNDHRNELHIFYADDPIDGSWHPHALNPVLIDARRARMAGGFLWSTDNLPIRCSQVQGKRYGEAVTYAKITKLSETSYEEDPLIGFDPVPITPGARTHHIAYRNGYMVADECLVHSKLALYLANRKQRRSKGTASRSSS